MACPGVARRGAFARSRTDLERLVFEALEQGEYPRVLGQGSNLLVPSVIDATVIVADGGEIQQSGNRLTVDAGVSWQRLVDYAIDHGLRGFENLTAIPGTVGASPVQNIGAYGVEVAEFVSAVEIIDFDSRSLKVLSPDECDFAYRESVFKQALDGKSAIVSVVFELSDDRPFTLDYGPLRELKERVNLTARDVAAKIAEIRWSKLPKPDEIPNSGSFFKNPTVPRDWYESRSATAKSALGPVYDMGDQVKLSAGWLIDQCDFKSITINDCRVYHHHALVITNPKHKPLIDVLELAKAIQTRVKGVYDVTLEIEPRKLV